MSSVVSKDQKHDIDSGARRTVSKSAFAGGPLASWIGKHVEPDNDSRDIDHESYRRVNETKPTARRLKFPGASDTRRNDAHQNDEGEPEPAAFQQRHYESITVALEESTARVEKQCELLEVQKKALLELQQQNSQEVIKQQRLRANTSKNAFPESNRSIEDLRENIHTARQEMFFEKAHLRRDAEMVCKRDDELYDSLSDLVGHAHSSSQRDSDVAEVEQLCSQLAALRGEKLKRAIYNVYNECLLSNSHGIDDDEHTELQNELESLLDEVPSVLLMGIEHDYRRPILAELDMAEHTSQARDRERLAHVQRTLTAMMGPMERIAERAEDHAGYSRALEQIRIAFEDADLQRTRNDPPKMSREVQRGTIDASSPVAALLQQLNIPKTDSLADQPAITASFMETAEIQKQSNVSKLAIANARGDMRQISEALVSADLQLQTLTGALYAYSPSTTVHLSDVDQNRRLVAMDEQLEMLSRDMKQTDTRDSVEGARRRLADLLNAPS